MVTGIRGKSDRKARHLTTDAEAIAGQVFKLAIRELTAELYLVITWRQGVGRSIHPDKECTRRNLRLQIVNNQNRRSRLSQYNGAVLRVVTFR